MIKKSKKGIKNKNKSTILQDIPEGNLIIIHKTQGRKDLFLSQKQI